MTSKGAAMIQHSAVSLDYLEECLARGVNHLVDEDGRPEKHPTSIVQGWRTEGREYAPPCDNVTPDGRCAGHEKEVAS